PLALYARLRAQSQAGYGALIDTGERRFLSLSPELFFALEDGALTCRASGRRSSGFRRARHGTRQRRQAARRIPPATARGAGRRARAGRRRTGSSRRR
ncbi:MAG: hypothetical protein EOP68_16455, partial [Sphingomonas sp.]